MQRDMFRWAIGIDLGGTAIKGAVIGEQEGIVTERTIPTDTASGPEGIVEQLAGLIAALKVQGARFFDASGFAGTGLGAPGAVNVSLGTLSYPPNLPGWTVFPLCDALQNCLKEKENLSVSVILENDANAAAFGEAMYGAGKHFSDFLMVTLGTGVGGGIILNRQLYRGANGTAGEVGFMIVDYEGAHVHAGIRGTLESLIGKERIVELASGMIKENPSAGHAVAELCGHDFTRLSPRHLEHAAKQGDPLSLALWQRVGEALGVGLANVTALMDIRKFVIGGGISAAGDLIITPAFERLRRSTLPSMHEGLDIVPAELGNRAGMYGAAALCFV
ncbi:ROK family protein [Chlorobium phaeobacteroides DSM 266]|uniref:ROK family protein n=2 Tax=Chlorobium phaeobacteroides TaxID=1096 RepID=A1BIY3_CHLPD|nr:ROK family protein [Chlorobium phaeobacteroides DSM 266]